MNQVTEAKGSLVVTKSLIGQAEDLAAEHEAFNTNYVIGGRKALYDLLGKIAVLVEQFDAAVDKNELIKIVRKNLQEQYGIKTQENTSDTTVLVRYITRADRKTAHVYTRAIETAKANQINPERLPEYLNQAGGVERIRANAAESSQSDLPKHSLKAKLDITRKYLNARREYPVASFTIKAQHDAHFGEAGQLNLLVCSEYQGRYYVLAKLPADTTLEEKVVSDLAEQLPDNLNKFRKNVERFYAKAMKKRSENTLKLLIKRRPAVAAGVLRNKRMQAASLAKSNTHSI